MGASGSSPKKASHPLDPFSLHEVIGVDHGFQGRDRHNVAAHDDAGAWRQGARDLAHLLYLADVGHDG